tara:strand:+ start:649 stop:915 length:267 start_codon:yes stop_codon:yes gene_type:complete
MKSMKKQKLTLQNLVNEYVKDHYVFTITTECNTGFTPAHDVEYQLREMGDEFIETHMYTCHISTRDEGQFYKEVVEYILESMAKSYEK